MRNIGALLCKEAKNSMKNKEVLVLFLVFPVMGWVLTKTIGKQPGLDPSFFIVVFAGMHAVFAPLLASASLLAEEKEKGTFRSLRFANVTLGEYLTGLGLLVWLADLLTGLTFLPLLQGSVSLYAAFLAAMSLGCLLSVVVGGCIGLNAEGTAAANSMSMPFGMLFAFLPMLASFSEPIRRAASLLYGQRVNELLAGKPLTPSMALTILCNLAVFLAAAVYFYRRNAKKE